MTMTLRSFFCASLMTAAWTAGSAQALENWGEHGAVEGSGFKVFPAVPVSTVRSFFDSFSFTLSAKSTVTASVTALQLPPGISITDATVSLFSGDPTDGIFDTENLPALAFPTGNAPSGKEWVIGPGAYFYEVSGNIAGTGGTPLLENVGGAYSFTSTRSAAPVPEPAMWGLMGVGGVLLAFALRRRIG